MKPAFLEKYLSSLLASASELIMDPSRLTTLHASILGHVGGHNKKDTGIKRAMLSSLVSQLVAWQSMHARLSLLETLSSVHDAAVLKGVIPIWSGLVIGDSEESQWLASHSQREQDAFLKVLGKTLDKGSGTALVNVEGESWRYFLGLLSSAPASRESDVFILSTFVWRLTTKASARAFAFLRRNASLRASSTSCLLPSKSPTSRHSCSLYTMSPLRKLCRAQRS